MLLVENRIVELKKLETAIPKNKIKKVIYRFNQALDGACEVEINDIDGQSVMLRGDQDTIQPAWTALKDIVNDSATNDDTVDAESNIVARYQYKPDTKFWRPSEITDSNLVNRFDDGNLFLTGAAAQLMEIIEQKISPFIEQEKASHFYSQPIWHEDQLQHYGYPENSKDLCRIGHFDEIVTANSDNVCGHEYWQNATCDNIWRSLKNSKIDSPVTFTTAGTCCRNETRNYYFLERLKTFRMREIVMAGDKKSVLAFRERAIDFVIGLAKTMQIDAILEKANDPFFLEDGQVEEDVPDDVDLPDCVKYEFRPTLYDEKSLACASFNVHGDFFSKGFNYRNSHQETVWTSCAAFGIERWVWAILVQHGPNPNDWPAALKDVIDLRP